ncbi:hypothetical protein DFH09DRAFT_1088884 [Mycena vulgaris]|nr:hypothetical protein DFH09DRAFT_1088884 [Mycena vulgaris]
MDTGPVVIRSSDARRLAIEHYVNLEAPALLARLDPGSLTKATGSTSAARTTAAVAQKAKWTAQNTAWGKDDGGWRHFPPTMYGTPSYYGNPVPPLAAGVASG